MRILPKGGFFYVQNKKILLAAFLLASLVVLARFVSIKTPIIRISFGFIPLILSAIWLGPKWSSLIRFFG